VAWVFAGIATGVCFAALLGGYLWLVADPFELSVARSGVPVARVQPLPMPSGAEIRLARARRLYAQGELRAALALLEAGDVDERYAGSVNELRATIQRQLIEAGRQRAGFPPPGAGDAQPAATTGQSR
jgi:antitoxin (DNA-binding transcriptional repressor) of toxin-antitoxin stability system